MSRQIKEELRRVLPSHTDIFIMYGATEASARLTYLEPTHFRKKINSIGKQIPGVTLKTIDERGQEVPPEKIGELVGNGPNIMLGYWKDKDSTAKVLDEHGYHTGDQGYRDEEGFFEIVDRKDNLIITGGEHVYPSEVEKVIGAHPGVFDVAIIGLSHEKWGEAVTAVVIPQDPNAPPAEQEIIAFCQGKLAGYKRPKKVRFISREEMPRTGSGKIVHRVLRERYTNVD